MSATALALVLAAAVLHATWNALAKGAEDSVAFLWVTTCCAAVLTLPFAARELTAGLAPAAAPFVLAALMVERFIELFQRYRRVMVWTTRIAGALLICVGALMLTDTMRLLSQWLNGFTPEFLRSRL